MPSAHCKTVNPMTIDSLIARLEEAKEGSRKLDAEIAVFLGRGQRIFPARRSFNDD